jgi:hypothetical protein
MKPPPPPPPPCARATAWSVLSLSSGACVGAVDGLRMCTAADLPSLAPHLRAPSVLVMMPPARTGECLCDDVRGALGHGTRDAPHSAYSRGDVRVSGCANTHTLLGVPWHGTAVHWDATSSTNTHTPTVQVTVPFPGELDMELIRSLRPPPFCFTAVNGDVAEPCVSKFKQAPSDKVAMLIAKLVAEERPCWIYNRKCAAMNLTDTTGRPFWRKFNSVREMIPPGRVGARCAGS